MTGPPLSISMDFIAADMVQTVGGFACALVLFAYAWWAPIVLMAAWLATHWLLREAAVWYDRNTEEVRAAQRDADYAYRLAVDAPASKELRLFGLADWTIGRFVARRTRLHDLQYAATRLREKPMLWSVVLVVVANVVVFWSLASAAADGRLTLGQVVAFVQSAVGVSMIAFGGLSWALDGAAAPVAAVLRLEPAMRTAGALASGDRKAAGTPAREIRFRDLSFGYPGGSARPRPLRPVDPGRIVARHRRPERRGQDDAGQAPVPSVRSARRRDRDRRRRCARAGPGVVAFAGDGGVPGFHPPRAAASRQRRARRRA